MGKRNKRRLLREIAQLKTALAKSEQDHKDSVVAMHERETLHAGQCEEKDVAIEISSKIFEANTTEIQRLREQNSALLRSVLERESRLHAIDEQLLAFTGSHGYEVVALALEVQALRSLSFVTALQDEIVARDAVIEEYERSQEMFEEETTSDRTPSEVVAEGNVALREAVGSYSRALDAKQKQLNDVKAVVETQNQLIERLLAEKAKLIEDASRLGESE